MFSIEIKIFHAIYIKIFYTYLVELYTGKQKMFYGERFVTRYAGTGRGMYTRNIILKWEWGRGLAGAHNFRLVMLIKTNIQYKHSLSMLLPGK